MKDLKAYWANDGGEWKMLVFAKNVREAKKIAFKRMPYTGVEWIHVRAWLADQRWMKMFIGDDYEDYYHGDYPTWEEYGKAEGIL